MGIYCIATQNEANTLISEDFPLQKASSLHIQIYTENTRNLQ